MMGKHVWKFPTALLFIISENNKKNDQPMGVVILVPKGVILNIAWWFCGKTLLFPHFDRKQRL